MLSLNEETFVDSFFPSAVKTVLKGFGINESEIEIDYFSRTISINKELSPEKTQEIALALDGVVGGAS